jgi:hypothetical protein
MLKTITLLPMILIEIEIQENIKGEIVYHPIGGDIKTWPPVGYNYGSRRSSW